MENELNIAAILKDKPEDTSLWSPIFGNVLFTCVNNTERDSRISIVVRHNGYTEEGFFCDGRFDKDGECLLFPSKQMQDWSKFAWKKGDILENENGYKCIFDSFSDEDYTSFSCAKYYCYSEHQDWVSSTTDMLTLRFKKVNESEKVSYIKKIEEHFGGKLNSETLGIEKSEPQFKDGDILTLDEDGNFAKVTLILEVLHKNFYSAYVFYNVTGQFVKLDAILADKRKNFRLATEEEKQQLFNALAKEGKRWNTETKTLEDLPKKCELKPFDRVLVKCSPVDKWQADLFSSLTGDKAFPYRCIGGVWSECIPYNEHTAHLLGTTDDWKGGEE